MQYEVIGPKGVILASGLTKRQAETYCANCGGKVRAENPAPQRGAKWLVSLKNFSTKATKVVEMPGGLHEAEAARGALLKQRGNYWQIVETVREGEALQSRPSKNPARKAVTEALPFRVEISTGDGKTWKLDSRHREKRTAVPAAHFLASKHPGRAVRVMKG